MSVRLKEVFPSLIPLLISGVLPLAFSSIIIQWVFQHQDLFVDPETLTLLGYTMVAALAMGLMLSPTTFIAMLSGFLLGWNGIPYVVLAYTIASIIGYFIGKLLDNGKIERLLNHFPKGKTFFSNLHRSEKQLAFVCRLSPVLPFAFTNVLLASINTSLSNFLIFGTLGMLPRTLLAIWAGKQASSIYNLQTQELTLNFESISLLVLVIFSMVFLTVLLKKNLTTTSNEEFKV